MTGMNQDGTAAQSPRLVILMPVFEDFEAARLVCMELDRELAQAPNVNAQVLLVDDGSPSGLAGWTPFALARLHRVDALRLRRNVGHQRAIAIGLCHVADSVACDAVLVMDADGEDRPADVRRLLEVHAQKPDQLIFAERRKRLEGGVFRVGYFCYRLLHRVLTGIPVRVGNFSLLPASALPRLVCMSELWSHYAGAALRSKLPQQRLPLDRGSRVLGKSKMGGIIPLVMHGIAGIATFHDLVATRILVASVGLVGLLALALVLVVAVRFGTALAIPGWATYTAGLLLVLSIQISTVAFGLVLSLISGRPGATFIPCRDYKVFAGAVENLGGRT
jgi:polyisoprenyl-phosphate glycosyltransferase